LYNLCAFVIDGYAIQNQGVEPALPGANASLLKGFGLPELLATTSFDDTLALV
jgi:hypothetical protein